MSNAEPIAKRNVSANPRGAFALTLLAAPALVMLDALVIKTCARSADVKTSSEGAVLTVSGAIVDAERRALRDVTVTVSGLDQATARTGADGAYSISARTKAGSTGPWSVQPSLDGCRFAPSVVRLRGSGQGAVANFSGAGESCVGSSGARLASPPIDRGPRPGIPGAGAPSMRSKRGAAEQAATGCISSLAAPMLLLCEQALLRFQQADSVSGTLVGEPGAGLGPTFSGNSCAMCHAQPAVLGSAPSARSLQNPIPNPQIALATRDGAKNVVPPFITLDGPVREVLFKNDNDIHALFTIEGRSDARGCKQAQPDFEDHLRRDNLSFRIPLALFGLGLVETLSEATLSANLAASSNATLGIAGSFNKSSNEGTIARFGWKAQNTSLLLFAGEAYSTEVGVTNELFPHERDAAEGCTLNGTPEDVSDPRRTGTLSDTSSDIENFAFAIRLSAPPVPAAPPGVARTSLENGERQFHDIGCANCHTPSLTTATSNLDPALSQVLIHPFSDFAIHHMGSSLADGIVQGRAGPDQFRTTPLWGVGQRLFFLHDGRATDLLVAIAAHASSGSEANIVIANFQRAPNSDKQDLVDFLRSL